MRSGGDLFALVHDGSPTPAALNASGRAGAGAAPDRLRAQGYTSMPFRDDVRTVTVPGCVDGWLALHTRYGRLPLREVLAPAIGYARDGFPAGSTLAARIPEVAGTPGAEELSGPVGHGTRLRRPGIARALAAIADAGRDAFYRGEFGTGLLRLGAGEFAPADLEHDNATWVTPLRIRAHGHDVWTAPPNSQGYLLLLALALAERLDLGDDPADARWAHLLIEAARQAGYDRIDVLHEHADGTALLDPGEIARRRAAVDPTRRTRLRDNVADGDTTHLCAVDGDRLAVSLIQSNAAGFGSRLFEPGTGVNLHNRGMGFSLVPGHPAEYRPGRRPPHTLSPVLVTRDEALHAVLGTMGGDAQPQILLQLLTRMLRYGASPGTAIGAPRWGLTGPATGFDTWDDPSTARVGLELGHPPAWAEGLRARGHPVGAATAVGHACAIAVTEQDMLAGAADPRAPGGAAQGY